MFPCRRHALALATLAAGAAAALPARADGDSPARRAQVEIIGTAPLPGLGVDRQLLPYSSQTLRRGSIDQAQAETMTDLLARRLPGMQVNDIQGSPFQADLTFRGHRASGLLGTAQGLSVYLDGVRLNEPFGDLVNWDMVPEFALGSLTVLPAANPSFGLNTLGGAIALETVDGRSAEGLRAELGAGSHGRWRTELGLGRQHGDGWHSYLGGTLSRDDGWRDFSPGRQALVLAKLGRSLGGSSWSLGLLAGSATLTGNGLLPAATLDDDGNATPDLLATSRHAVYTHPDRTRNRLAQLTFQGSRQLDDGGRLQALAYLRHSRRDAVNGDAADAIDPAAPDLNAALNSSRTRQTAWGLALSLARRSGAHQWQVGASLDANRVRYRQQEQEGRFDASRGVLAGDEDPELSAEVTGTAQHLGLYATDTWQAAPGLHVTATLRANHSRVGNRLTTVDDDTDQLEVKPHERFTYRSLNPALGVLRQVGGGWSVFGNLARNTRVPTAIELGCADPAEPCRLPIGLQSDPYLKQVRATSLEAGLRWRPPADAWAQRAELALFRTTNRDDIVFGSLSTTSQLGYFQNFARTRHQGLDASWQAKVGPVALSAGYSQLLATYQATGTLRMGERNVQVRPGLRIAGLPRHTARLAADWTPGGRWSVGADWQLVSSRGVQGNEDGLLEDGAAETHRLRIGGHGLLHLRAQWQAAPGLVVLARVQNVLDRHHATWGALGETLFDARGGTTVTAREALFVAPGAPRSLWLGLRVTL